jgi:hypothetical protein
MPSEFASIMACSYGPAAFQLTDYTVNETGEVKEGLGRVGSVITVSGEGYVEASSPADLSTQIAAVVTAFRSSGRPLTITGLGGVAEYTLPLRGANDGGPHTTEFDLLDVSDEAPLVRRFTFAVEWRGVPSEGDGGGTGDAPVENSYTVGKTTRTDSRNQVSYRGELRGPNAGNHFRTVTLPGLRQNYNPLVWTVVSEHTVNLANDRCDYTITFTELANPLPTGTPTAIIVDGEITTSQEMDATGRMTRTISLDLQVKGDPLELLTIIRPKEPPVILSERFETTQIKETRLRASFVTLAGRFGNDLIEWEQTLTLTVESVGERVVFEYIGRPPQFGVKEPIYRASQRGRAVAVGRYLREAQPFFLTQLERPPQATFRPIDLVQRETTWAYDFISATAFTPAGVLNKLLRPADPAKDPGWY